MWNSALPCQIGRERGETSILRRFSTTAKNIINFMFVCPSARMELLGFYWKDFREIWYLSIFRKCFEQIQE